MKEHTTQELEGHRIRIEGGGNVPVGHKVHVTDLDTGETIQNVALIELSIVPNELITARLSLAHIGTMKERSDGSSQATLLVELLTVNNPELDLNAFVEESNPCLTFPRITP